MLKENYRKIGKKKDNDMDANMAQLKRNNNKCYISTLMCVCVCVCWYDNLLLDGVKYGFHIPSLLNSNPYTNITTLEQY